MVQIMNHRTTGVNTERKNTSASEFNREQDIRRLALSIRLPSLIFLASRETEVVEPNWAEAVPAAGDVYDAWRA